MDTPTVTVPARHRTHIRTPRPSAESFLLEQAEIERVLTHNFKTHALLPTKINPPPKALPPRPGGWKAHIPSSPQPRNAIYPHGSRCSASTNQFLPDVRPGSSMSLNIPVRDASTDGHALTSHHVFSMRMANKSEGSLQQLNFPHRPPPGPKKTLRLEHSTPDLKNHPYQQGRLALATGLARSRAPSIFSTLSLGSPATLDVSSRDNPKRRSVDSHQFLRQGTYIQPKDQEKESALKKGDRKSPSAQVNSRVASPIPYEVLHPSVTSHDDDASGISTELTTPLATNGNSDASSKSFDRDPDHYHDQYHDQRELAGLGPPKMRNILPVIDHSPLFTEHDTETVMGLFKRMSGRFSGKPSLILEQDEEKDDTSDYSWEARSIQHIQPAEEAEVQKHLDQVSVRQLSLKESKRSRQLSDTSNVSLLLRALEPSSLQGQRPKSELLLHKTPNPTPQPVTRYAGVGSIVRRNGKWAAPRDGTPVSAWNTRWQPQQLGRGRVLEKPRPSVPPPTRPLLLRSMSTKTRNGSSETIYDHGVYHTIMPDLPRSRSLRLASTISLSAVEERLRHKHERERSDDSHYTNTGGVAAHGDTITRPVLDISSLQDAGRKSPEHQPRAPSPQPQPYAPSLRPRAPSPQPRAISPPQKVDSDAELTRKSSTPFLYRPKRSQSLGAVGSFVPPTQNEEGLKSFMDILPEQDVRFMSGGKRKSKLKVLLKRAKLEIISWGRSLIGKRSDSELDF